MEIACSYMKSFSITQTLATHTRFTVLEAHGERFQFPVVLKRCEYREVSEAEFFIRSALMKTKNKVYSQPLLSIFADVEGDKSLIVFMWKKGNALDVEVERDEESQFPSGKAGYDQLCVLYKNPLTKEAVKRALCQTLGREVALKISKRVHMLEMNPVFTEALTQAKCAHPNVCDFLDFRLFLGKSGHLSSYIVMESLKQDLAMEIQERKLEPYDEGELMTILQQVTAALLNAKHQEIAHQDIKPHNILRGPQGLKVADFGAIWPKGLYSRTSSAIDIEMYISPEAGEAMESPKVLQRPFESDVFSLGMTMLHLAAMELPERTPTMRRSKLQALIQLKVQALRYSKRLKRLLTTMLSTAPSDRPSLEAVQMDAERIYRKATQRLVQNSRRLTLQASSNDDKGEAIELAAAAHAHLPRLSENKRTADDLYNRGVILRKMGKNEEAVEKYAAAHAIYSQLFKHKRTAKNLCAWGMALDEIERRAEAVEKHAEAHAIFSQLPESKSTANNLCNWGTTLDDMGRSAEAVEKHAAAHAIYSRFPEDKRTAKNLCNWGVALGNMGKSEEAMEKYAAAHVIYSRFSKHKRTANNLCNWGAALGDLRRNEEAVEKHAAAHAIYSRLPEGRRAANNLCNWGAALGDMRRNEEAVKKHAAAHAIYSRLPEDKRTAKNLCDWGVALDDLGRSAEAVEKHAAAHAIYSRLPEDKRTANNLCYWGVALCNMERNAEAVEKHVAAHAIYSRLREDKRTANNLCDWGNALANMGRSAEAVEKYEAARALYALHQLNSAARNCDDGIAGLR